MLVRRCSSIFLAVILVVLLVIGCDGDSPVPTGPAEERHIVLVRADGTGDCATIQDAISASTAGDTIELADGTFTGEGNRDIDFMGRAITLRSQSGDPALCVIDCEGDSANPHRGFIFRSGEFYNSLLVGIRIRSGYLLGGMSTHATHGAGVYCEHSSPRLIMCTFEGNSAVAGGGIYIGRGSSPDIVDCSFMGNYAHRGGGLSGESGSEVLLSDCCFEDNVSAATGGAIHLESNSSNMRDCSFRSNLSEHGGAVFSRFADVLLLECDFHENTGHYRGGAIGCEHSSHQIDKCEFVNNVALGGIGGGIDCYMSVCTASMCTFFWNSAAFGGCVSSTDSYCIIMECTFSDNGGGSASGIFFAGGRPHIERTIIAYGREGAAVYNPGTDRPVILCCNLFGNSGGDWTSDLEGQLGRDGNISAPPLFCDRENGDLSLRMDSPCIADSTGCGTMGAWPEGCD